MLILITSLLLLCKINLSISRPEPYTHPGLAAGYAPYTLDYDPSTGRYPLTKPYTLLAAYPVDAQAIYLDLVSQGYPKLISGYENNGLQALKNGGEGHNISGRQFSKPRGGEMSYVRSDDDSYSRSGVSKDVLGTLLGNG